MKSPRNIQIRIYARLYICTLLNTRIWLKPQILSKLEGEFMRLAVFNTIITMHKLENTPLKDFDGLFEILDIFESTNKITCKLLNAKDMGFYSKAIIYKIINSRLLTIELTPLRKNALSFVTHKNKIESFELEIKGLRFKTEKISIVQANYSKNSAKIVVNIYGLIKSKENTSIYRQRLILPCQEDISLHFHFENLIGYKIKEYRNINLISCIIDTFHFDIFIVSQEINKLKKYYLIVDSQIEIEFTRFQDNAYSILIGFGYITGCFVQNIGYYFSYDKENILQEIYIQSKRHSVYAQLSPIYKNPYGIFQNTNYHDKYNNVIRGIKASEFSKLCQLINTYDEFKVIILLILESCVSTLIIQPAGFAVALEGFATFIKKEIEKEKEKKSPKLSSKILEDLKTVLKNNKEEIGDSFDLFNKKIEQINQPTNKDTLLKPFEYLKIPTNELDEQAIANRNDLLHGRYDLKSQFEGKDSEKYRYSTSLRLYTLLSTLILKYIGFDNKVINQPLRNDSLNIAFNEEPFRQI